MRLYWMNDYFLLHLCEDFYSEENMSSVPQGAFAARKINKNDEKRKNFHENNCDISPTKYNEKYMNSVWGMYNRYSVHNLKKVMEYQNTSASANGSQRNLAANPAEKTSADNTGINKPIGTGIRIPSPHFFLYSPM